MFLFLFLSDLGITRSEIVGDQVDHRFWVFPFLVTFSVWCLLQGWVQCVIVEMVDVDMGGIGGNRLCNYGRLDMFPIWVLFPVLVIVLG